jgi:hypothetical protein
MSLMPGKKWSLVLGVVASVCWALGAGWHKLQADDQRAFEVYSFYFDLCSSRRGKRKDFDFQRCLEQGNRTYKAHIEERWQNAAFIALVPILPGWGIAFLVLATWRRVAKNYTQTAE